ncbi:hypothetical protein ACFQ3Y_08975 [Paenibacillus motobuensis]|uniref:hypothetical protein n=1 Tax=Paenibacillus motobuensis TaxID=295324 RepID=UPI00362D9549
MIKLASPDIIRETAIEILKNQSKGMRQSDLFTITGTILESKGYQFDKEHSIKNALWNLQEKYPDIVEKRNVGKRTAILLYKQPLETRLAESKSLYSLDTEPNSAAPLKLRIQAFLLDFDDLIKENEKLFDSIFGLEPSSYKHLSHSEIDAIHNVRIAYQLILEARDAYLKGE